RAIERNVRRRRLESDRWTRSQKKASEGYTAELFATLLPDAEIIIDAHYWAKDGNETKWTDCDVLAIFCRRLFVIEVKAGRYTHKPPGKKIRDHRKSLKELIENAAKQANRLVENLLAGGTLEILNAKQEVQFVLDSSAIDTITRCCVSLDCIGDIASRSEDLALIGVDIGENPIWTLSISDLMVYADIFTNPLIFIDYVDERMRAFASPKCHVSDELDHLGLYLEHNRYANLSEQFKAGSVENWTGYRDRLDRYYAKVWRGEEATLPSQQMPKWLSQILEHLSESRNPDRCRIAIRLLEIDGETRCLTGEMIRKSQLAQCESGRVRPVNSQGDVRFTFLVNANGVNNPMTYEDARNHTLDVIGLENEKDRVLFYLTCSEDGTITDLACEILDHQQFLRIDAEERSTRVTRLASLRAKLSQTDIYRFNSN
ncbi:MAG: nuclease-related domain-containing protein, partial [Planctomycetota bacterium]